MYAFIIKYKIGSVEMNELQLPNYEQISIDKWDFEKIKKTIEFVLSRYEKRVYTDESLDLAKKDKSDLGKFINEIEDKRKAFKKKCLQPYDEIEGEIKEITAMLEEQRNNIDGFIKDFSDRQKSEKENEVRKFYNKKASHLGELSDKLYFKIRDKSWFNKSTSKSKYESDILEKIKVAENETDSIRRLNTPFEKDLLDYYLDGHSLEETLAKNDEYTKATHNAGFSDEYEYISQKNEEAKKIQAIKDNGLLLKICTSSTKFKLLCDYMEIRGIDYEIM